MQNYFAVLISADFKETVFLKYVKPIKWGKLVRMLLCYNYYYYFGRGVGSKVNDSELITTLLITDHNP